MTVTSTDPVLSLTANAEKLWSQFRPHQMEMVVIKNGRKMFPKLEYRISNLDPLQCYAMVLRMERVDDMRHKFSAGRWQTCGKGEPRIPEKAVAHTDGIQTGEYWNNKNISFDFVRLSNSMETHGENVVVIHSMHKYLPVVDLYLVPAIYNRNTNLADPNIQKQKIETLSVSGTDFIAVTAYQNQKITEIKIAKNPFAKGFREKGEKRRATSPTMDQKQSRTPFFSGMNTFPAFPPVDYNWFQPAFLNPFLMPGSSQPGPSHFASGNAYPQPGLLYPYPVETSSSNTGYVPSSLDMTPPSRSSLVSSVENSPELRVPYPVSGYNPNNGLVPNVPDYCQMGQSWQAYDAKSSQFNYGYQS